MTTELLGRVVHVVIGDSEHGVVRHAVSIAEAFGHPVARAGTVDRLDLTALDGADIIHIAFTDRLFGAQAEEAAVTFAGLAEEVRTRGAALSVTLHDLPAGASAWADRRRVAYRAVCAPAAGVVVNSRRELDLVAELVASPRSLRMIPLPIERVPAPPARPAPDATVVVLGFVFPDRGYEQVIAALPDHTGLLALGRASAGHESLPDELSARAADSGHTFDISGFVPDADLAAQLWSAGVPVAPNRRVAASGSIGTWIGHGRRPLVPDTTYTRELEARAPGTLWRYDPDDPEALRSAIARSMADPSRTWITPGTPIGPDLAEVTAAHRRHWVGCAPARALPVGPSRWIVPGNRWDLVPTEGRAPAEVSVIVPCYEGQDQLDRVLTALTRQTHPADRYEVIVADDGSATAPDLGAAEALNVTLVRQSDQGFRAAAARNLGARAASGEVLLFLDQDTVPEPGYVAALSRLPAYAPDALVVGRRRHADFSTDPPGELTEPPWLRDGYRDSRDLLDADQRSYRYVISAVFGLPRDLFAELGGFCEDFDGYGGEDWELAHRAWVAGALLAHVPEAIAWHDGPDWAERGDPDERRISKNAETTSLTRLLPDPVSRGGGQWLPYPAVLVTLPDHGPAATLAAARSAFARDADSGVWVHGPDADRTAATLGDPRIRAGLPPGEVRARALVTIELDRPGRVDVAGWASGAQTYGSLTGPAGVVLAGRAHHRAARWAPLLGVDEAELTAWLFGGHDSNAPTAYAGFRLHHELGLNRS